jgi:hypothetical protein
MISSLLLSSAFSCFYTFKDKAVTQFFLHSPRQRERQMRRFKTAGQEQRFLTAHGAVGNLFRVGRHLIRAAHYREFRSRAFAEWQQGGQDVTSACYSKIDA